MKQPFKQEWIEALRSGKYKQGVKYLRYNEEFCCLGVLCDLVAPTAWQKHDCWDFYYNDGIEGYLPPSVIDKVGLFSNQENKLAVMNDNGKTFEEIADYIEKYV